MGVSGDSGVSDVSVPAGDTGAVVDSTGVAVSVLARGAGEADCSGIVVGVLTTGEVSAAAPVAAACDASSASSSGSNDSSAVAAGAGVAIGLAGVAGVALGAADVGVDSDGGSS